MSILNFTFFFIWKIFLKNGFKHLLKPNGYKHKIRRETYTTIDSTSNYLYLCEKLRLCIKYFLFYVKWSRAILPALPLHVVSNSQFKKITILRPNLFRNFTVFFSSFSQASDELFHSSQKPCPPPVLQGKIGVWVEY